MTTPASLCDGWVSNTTSSQDGAGQCVHHVVTDCRGIKIAIVLKNSTPDDGKLRAFHRHLKANADRSDIIQLREEVEEFATAFPMPGL